MSTKKRKAKGDAGVKAKKAAKAKKVEPTPASKPEPAKKVERGERHTENTSRAMRASAAISVAAAVVVAVLVNILGARHYKRWDFTDDGLYTISRATEQTLKTLPQEVELYVLLSKSDPLSLTLRHLLEAYQGLTTKLVVHNVDPDRNPAEFLAVQQKYGIAAGKMENGQIITDASIVVVMGERKHFITAQDLIEVHEGQEAGARSKVEQTLTAGIRLVVSGETPQVCFTSGHGEPLIDEGGSEGLLALHSRLDKLNYQVSQLPPLRDLDGRDTIEACKLVVVAGPTQRLNEAEVTRLKRFVEDGGNLLAFVGLELSASDDGFVDQGLAPVLALAGLGARNDVVFERDQARMWAQEEAIILEPKPHPITRVFIELQGAVPIVAQLSRSLSLLPKATVVPMPLLSTSDSSFGMRASSFAEWAENPREPKLGRDDTPGPLVLAYAAELPSDEVAAGDHGPRMVVVGTNSMLRGAPWTNERWQGTGLFVESAVSWLASTTVLVDVPSKPVRSLGSGMTQEALSSAALKLVVLLPLSVVLLGLAMGLRRRLGSKNPERGASA